MRVPKKYPFQSQMKYPLLISPFSKKKTTSPVETSKDTILGSKYPLLQCDDKTSLYVFLLYLAKGISNPLSARAIEGYIITSIETRILRLTLEHMHKKPPLRPWTRIHRNLLETQVDALRISSSAVSVDQQTYLQTAGKDIETTTGNSVHRQILQVSFPRAVRKHPWIKVKE